MKTSDLIDKSGRKRQSRLPGRKVTQRRLAELRTGAVMAIEGEKIFMRIHDRYAFARKQS